MILVCICGARLYLAPWEHYTWHSCPPANFWRLP
jgi:hypothetical protein